MRRRGQNGYQHRIVHTGNCNPWNRESPGKGCILGDVGRISRKGPESETDQLRTGQGQVRHGRGPQSGTDRGRVRN